MPEGNYENNKYQKQFLDSRFGQQFKGQTGYCKTTEYIREYSHWYYQMKRIHQVADTLNYSSLDANVVGDGQTEEIS